MPAERWADVPGCPGYQASDQGRVRTLDRKVLGRDGRTELHKGKILHQQKMKNGYLEVYISLGARRKHRTVHTLVAQTFLGEKPKGFDVMHIDGDRSNNTVENLRYGTRSENLHATYDYGGRQANGKLSLDDVDDIRARLDRGESCGSIAREFGVNSAAIYHIRDGKSFAWYEGRGPLAGSTCLT